MDNQNSDIITSKEKANLVRGKWTLIFLAITLILFYFFNFYNTVLSQESTAQFGDFFGGVLNPILGFATVILLVWSIQIQLKELKLTRDELILNTKANIEQAKELRIQNKLFINKEKNDTSQLEFKEFQNIFMLQQSLLNNLLDKILVLTITGESLTANELIYSGHSNYQQVFDEYIETLPSGSCFLKYQIDSSLQQCVWLTTRILSHCNLPSFVYSIKANINWLAPLIRVCTKKKLISLEVSEMHFKQIKNSIESSDFKEHEQKLLLFQLEQHK